MVTKFAVFLFVFVLVTRLASAQTSCEFGHASEFDPTTMATMRVWVDDGAIVTINGYRTNTWRTPADGFRIFTLPGLTPGQLRKATVDVRINDHFIPIEVTELVTAGGCYDVRFPPLAQAQLVAATGPPVENVARGLPEPLAGTAGSKADVNNIVARLESVGATFQASTDKFDGSVQKLNAGSEQFAKSTALLNESATKLSESLQKIADAAAKNEAAAKLIESSSTKFDESATAIVKAEEKLATTIVDLTEKMEVLITQLDKEKDTAAGDRALTAAPSAERSYSLTAEGEIRATLSYNAALEISGIVFDASHLKDNITFTDGNDWNLEEVANTGELTLRLRIRVLDKDGNEQEKDFLPTESNPQTIEFQSHKNRSAVVPFVSGADNLKKWIEETVAKNPSQANKFHFDDRPKALILTGEFKLGFADAVELSKPLEIIILH